MKNLTTSKAFHFFGSPNYLFYYVCYSLNLTSNLSQCRLPLTNLELWFKRQSCYVGAFNPKIKISSHYLKRSPSKEPFVCYFVVGHLFLPKVVAAANGEKNSGVSEFLPFFSTFPCCILFSKVPICSSQFSRIYLESCLHPTPQTLWADCA